VADSAITIGVIWLIIEFLFPKNKQEKAEDSKKSLS
jgi:lipoprotein signal peptidase